MGLGLNRSPLWTLAILLFTVRGPAFGSDAFEVPASQQPYCGVSSLYAASCLLDHPIKFEDLLHPEFVPVREGSTLEGLEKAIQAHGLYGLSLKNMTILDLQRSEYPIILLTNSDDGSSQYRHFLLYVRSEGNAAVLLDAPMPLRRIPFHELARMWNGTALIVSATPIDEAKLLLASRARVGVLFLISLLLVATVHIWRKPRRQQASCKFRHSARQLAPMQASGLLITAAVTALLYHRLDPSGFLANPDATTAIDQANAGTLLSHLTLQETKDLVSQGAVLVDARLAADFHAGHIDGTINIPIGTDHETRRRLLTGISQDRPVIVFCKSASCGFSLDVAKDLLRDGYHDVRLFRGGWDEWVSTYGGSSGNLRKSSS